MNLVALPRAVLSTASWDAFVEAHPAGWFFHRGTWLDYCLAYAPGSVDDSFALVNADGAIQAVVPLVCERDAYTMGGEPTAAPLVTAPDLWGAVDTELRRRIDAAGVRRAAFRAHPVAPNGVVPALPPLAGYARRSTWRTFVVDLRYDEADRWKAIRKSYRYLIRRAEAERVVHVTRDRRLLGHAQRLHRAAAGRETRAQLTWDLMGDWLEQGDALLALVSPRMGDADRVFGSWTACEWTGFAYAIRWKLWSYYASGATLEKDTAHALQWALTRALACDGRHHYEVGWDARPGEDDEKARGISLFKSGFGGSVGVVHATEWTR